MVGCVSGQTHGTIIVAYKENLYDNNGTCTGLFVKDKSVLVFLSVNLHGYGCILCLKL